MRFKLIYKGQVKINPKKRTQHINKIRMVISEQLKNLYEIDPYSDLKKLMTKTPGKPSIIRTVGGVDFISLISPEMNFLAEINMQLLVPELTTTPRADIDNRMKTLLDALRRPQDSHEVAQGVDKTQPVYTLLDDDKYVSELTINTSHLLDQSGDEDEVLVIISVGLRATKATQQNFNFLI
ncbi:MAG: hypothetical protein LBR35_01850 [Rickettsiales bacterium]|jgi:hypothetical protein|nr:hypothetical protein [Rickettsiales bacterium]